jgi:hypothetical protein
MLHGFENQRFGGFYVGHKTTQNIRALENDVEIKHPRLGR